MSDIDCRWGVISASVDDRTREERGLEVGTLFLSSLLNPAGEEGGLVATDSAEVSLTPFPS